MDKDKNKIQKQVRALKVEIYKDRLEQKRREKDYIENSKYSYDEMESLRARLASYEHDILKKQERIDNLLAEIKATE